MKSRSCVSYKNRLSLYLKSIQQHILLHSSLSLSLALHLFVNAI
jgi:hypothetical protein